MHLSLCVLASVPLGGRGFTPLLSSHPWTNGRIERLFGTFKETIFRCAWLLTSLRQIDQ